MAYGDYDGPEKADKGVENGSCNRTRCQAPGAIWFNHGSYAWYCADCRRDIEEDPFNKRDWNLRHLPECGHPMFETREMMDVREAAAQADATEAALYESDRGQYLCGLLSMHNGSVFVFEEGDPIPEGRFSRFDLRAERTHPSNPGKSYRPKRSKRR